MIDDLGSKAVHKEETSKMLNEVRPVENVDKRILRLF